MNQKDIKKVIVPLPLEEQQAIVDKLDRAFAGLETARANAEANLENAKELFQAGLSGSLRNGVAAEPGWKPMELGSFCEIYQPKTISKKEMTPDRDIPFGANGVIGRYSQYNHEEAEVLVTCRGATCGTVNISTPCLDYWQCHGRSSDRSIASSTFFYLTPDFKGCARSRESYYRRRNPK